VELRHVQALLGMDLDPLVDWCCPPRRQPLLPSGQTLANFDFAFQPSIEKGRVKPLCLRDLHA
jgi:hypothetical protein